MIQAGRSFSLLIQELKPRLKTLIVEDEILNIFSKKKTSSVAEVKEKRNEKITFMMMRVPGKPIRDIRMSAKGFKIGLALFCFSLVGVGATGAFFIQDYAVNRVTLSNLAAENQRLAETNATQAVEIEDLQYMAGSMLSKMAALEEMKTEVRAKVGLEDEIDLGNESDPVTDPEDKAVAGLTVSRSSGLDSLSDYSDYADYTGTDAGLEMDSLEDLKQELLDMDKKLSDQAASMQALMSDVDKQLAYNEALPDLWPMEGKISSKFGYRKNPFGSGTEFHNGLDIANKSGTKMRVAGSGVVTFAGYKSGWGNLVMVSHGYGYVSIYAHCSEILVKEGQEVTKGEIIAKCGATGRATGSHLHYGIQYDGEWIDPLTVLVAEDTVDGQ